MKNFIKLAIIFMAISYAFAQTSLNPKKLIGTVTDVSFTSTAPSSTFNRDYNKNNFLLAWNWGS